MRAPPPEVALAGAVPERRHWAGPWGLRREGKRWHLSSSPPVLPLLNASHSRRPPGPVPSLCGWRLPGATPP